MLGNVVDKRTNPYRVEVDVVYEPSCNDNSCDGATQFSEECRDNRDCFDVDWRYDTTVEQAIQQALAKWSFPVTVYLYDRGSRPVD
jgi:hypothetical protein